VKHLSTDDIKKLEARLNSQRLDLLRMIREHRHQGGDGGEPGLSNHFSEVREQAEASLLADTDIRQLRIELDELRGIDGALARAASGSYGVCTRCSTHIAAQRMRALPTAEMCLDCQKMLEQQRQSLGPAAR
jgi:DnaK suppressor protein